MPGIVQEGQNSAAQPYLYAKADPLGGGLFGYRVFVDDLLEDNYSAYFLDNLTFHGNIQHLIVGKNQQIHSNDAAEDWDGFGDYDMTRDSYFFQPFTGNTVNTGIVQTDTSYGITAGSGGGSLLKNTQIAYIVVSGPLTVSGKIARSVMGSTESANFIFQGTVVVPEPSTCALLALGAVALLPLARLRRRR